MEIWNDIVSFFTSVWAYVEPYWTYINDFMGQTYTYNLWWFLGIVCVSFMIGRMTKKVAKIQEKVIYKDKEIKVCPTNCILITAQKLYENIEVDQVDFETQDEQNEGMEVRRKIMEYCMEEAKKLHQETKPN